MRRVTHAEYLKKLKALGIKVQPTQTYDGATTKIRHKCPCGTEWKVKPCHVLRGVQCGECATRRIAKTRVGRTSHEGYLLQLAALKVTAVPIENYKGRCTAIRHRCECGTVWRVQPRYFSVKKRLEYRDANGVQGCPKCSQANKSSCVPLTHSEYVRRVEEKFGSSVLVTSPYRGAALSIEHTCCECGTSWDTKPLLLNDQTYPCPLCYQNNYVQHSQVAVRWLTEMSKALGRVVKHAENGGEQVVRRERLPPYRLDGYNKALNLAFEFLGDYWHLDANGRMCAKTRAKLRYLRLCGFSVVYVWEKDYLAGRLVSRVSGTRKVTNLLRSVA